MDNLCLSLLLLFVFSVTCFLFRFFYKHRALYVTPNIPPGKIGLPFVGESLEFLSTGWKGHPERFIFDRIARYSYIFKTSLFGEPFIIFCGAGGNKLLFTNENKLVTWWWPESLDKIFPSSTQPSFNEEAMKMRKMVLNFLKPQALQRYIEVMDTIAQRHFAMEWEGKDEVTVSPLAKQCTFWIATRLFISFEDPSDVARFAIPFKHLGAGMVSIPINLPGTPFNRAIKASNFIKKELRSIIKQRKADLADRRASPTQDILSHFILATDEDGKHMTELDITDRILGLLFGGYDSLTAICTFIVKYLAELPEIYDQVYKGKKFYEQVYKEQMKIANSKALGELLNWEDIQKMKYSWNVACEVMRLTPPVGGTFRRVINDFIFNGFSIPKGLKIYWSTHSTHKSAQYFPEPEKFDPTRFEGDGPAPYTFVPFGGGPRMCPGKEYARLVVLVFMHNLVKKFRWEKLLLDEKVVFDPVPMLVKGLPVRLYSHKY